MKMKRESWSDFFDGRYTPKNETVIDVPGQYLVSNCKFVKLNQNAIRFSNSYNSENKLLTEYCYFSDVKSLDKGSAIFFETTGEVCMNRLCGINCYTNSYNGHFSYTEVTYLKTDSKNFMNFSSVISCGQTKKGYYVCNFIYGKAQMSQTNFSNCKADQGSGFMFLWTKSPSFSELSVFENGTVYSLVAYMQICTDTQIYKSNFINNENGTCFLNRGCGKSVVEDCIFVNNSANPLFMSIEHTTLTIIHCYFENQEIKYGSYVEGTFDTSSQATDKFDNKLYDLKPCEALELFLLKKSKKFVKTCRCATRNGKLLSLFIFRIVV